MIQFIQNNLMWFWLSVMVVCVLIEALTLALTSVWAAIAALIMIFVSQTGLPFKWQLLIFLLLTIVLIVTTRPFAVKKLKLGKNKTNVNSLVGQEVLVVKKISPFQKGEVKAKNGVIWTAQNADPQSSSEIPEGTVCTIEKIDGNTLSVKPLS